MRGGGSCGVSANEYSCTLIKKKIKLYSYIRKFRVEQLQSHIWLTAFSYMGKYLHISSYIRKLFLIYDFSTAPLWISLYMRKIRLSFLSVYSVYRSPNKLWRSNSLFNLWNYRIEYLILPRWQEGFITSLSAVCCFFPFFCLIFQILQHFP